MPVRNAPLLFLDSTAHVRRWESVAAPRGFEPGEIVPTTALLLAHKHPAGRGSFEQLFLLVRTRGGTVAGNHGMVDGSCRIRSAAMIATAAVASDGSVSTWKRHLLDLSSILTVQGKVIPEVAAVRAVEKRHDMGQAEEILMCLSEVDRSGAFAMLAQNAQRTQRKP